MWLSYRIPGITCALLAVASVAHGQLDQQPPEVVWLHSNLPFPTAPTRSVRITAFVWDDVTPIPDLVPRLTFTAGSGAARELQMYFDGPSGLWTCEFIPGFGDLGSLDFSVVFTDEAGNSNVPFVAQALVRVYYPAVVQGRVTDSFNGRPIPNAQLTLTGPAGEAYTASTDRDGRYGFTVIGAATYNFAASHAGYAGGPQPAPPWIPAGESLTWDADLRTKTVVLVHGTFASSAMWGPQSDGFSFAEMLENCRDTLGTTLCDFEVDASLDLVDSWAEWLSPWVGARTLAQRLADHLATLRAQGIMSVDVVAHSLGGLVARQVISMETSPGTIRRLAMLGTPNHGTELAGLGGAAAGFSLCFLLRIFGVAGNVACAHLDPRPGALVDQTPRSAFLDQLNYGGTRVSVGNRCCVGCAEHPTELGLPGAQRLVTIAGTGFQTEPRREIWLAGQVLAALTHCTNDGVVPAMSVALHAVDPENPVENFLDTELDCLAGHKVPTVPEPLTQSSCILEAVRQALSGDGTVTPPLPPLPPAGPAAEAQDDEAHTWAAGFTLLPQEVQTSELLVSSADSLALWCGAVGAVNVHVLDPSGNPLPVPTLQPTQMLHVPAKLQAGRTSVPNPQPGTWTVVVTNTATTDTALAAVTAQEHGCVGMTLELGAPEVAPNAPQHIAVAVDDCGLLIPSLTVAGTVRGPAGSLTSVELFDDGVHGDGSAADGTYGQTIVPADGTGEYRLDVQARGGSAQGAEVHRSIGGWFAAVARPDLAITADDIELRFLEIGDTARVRVTAICRNLGAADAESVRVVLLDGTTRQAFGEVYVPAIPAGGAVPVTADWTVRTGAAEYPLGARADVMSPPEEASLADNEAFAVWAVPTSAPSIVPSPQPAGPTPRQAAPVRLAVFPNPGNPSVTIQFEPVHATNVDVTVFDLRGRRVRVLLHARVPAQQHGLSWDGRDGQGVWAGSGVYLVRVVTDDGPQTCKVMLLR